MERRRLPNNMMRKIEMVDGECGLFVSGGAPGSSVGGSVVSSAKDEKPWRQKWRLLSQIESFFLASIV